MLSWITYIAPAISAKDAEVVEELGVTEMPNVWETDQISLTQLQIEQRRQFEDYFIEAEQGTDETRYIT